MAGIREVLSNLSPFPGTGSLEFGAQALPEQISLEEMMPADALWPPDWMSGLSIIFSMIRI